MDMKLADISKLPKLAESFGPIKQVAYIVGDIEAAMNKWREMGVAVFLVTRNVSPVQNAFYRGEKSGNTPVHIAFGYLGEMQIELIEPLDQTPSIYNEAIDRKITGVHHYAICVDDFAKEYGFCLDNGYEAVLDSGVDGLARMSYVENRTSNVILEMIEWNDLTRPYLDGIHEKWKAANILSHDVEFSLSELTPKAATFKALMRYLPRKLTGRIKSTRRTNAGDAQ